MIDATRHCILGATALAAVGAPRFFGCRPSPAPMPTSSSRALPLSSGSLS